jgi:hypothetical protein
MRDRGIKRLPVLHGDKIVGMIYQDDLMRVCDAKFDTQSSGVTPLDVAIKDAVLDILHSLKWTASPLIEVTVNAGQVELQGTLLRSHERNALAAAIESIPGVTRYTDHLVLAEVPYDMFPRLADELIRRPKLYC